MGLRATAFRWMTDYEGPGASLFNAMGTRMHRPVYPHVAAALDLRPGDRLLDVACGEGAFLAEHASDVARVAGLDASPSQVAAARRRLGDRLAAGTAEIVRGDAASLPWPDETFTKVSCMGSLEFMAAPVAALAEMRRVLASGGIAAVTMGYEGIEESRPGERNAWGLPVWGDEPARAMMHDAGFSDVTITYVDWGGDSARLVLGTKQ
jgi:SAM-dependent methyltransferase